MTHAILSASASGMHNPGRFGDRDPIGSTRLRWLAAVPLFGAFVVAILATVCRPGSGVECVPQLCGAAVEIANGSSTDQLRRQKDRELNGIC